MYCTICETSRPTKAKLQSHRHLNQMLILKLASCQTSGWLDVDGPNALVDCIRKFLRIDKGHRVSLRLDFGNKFWAIWFECLARPRTKKKHWTKCIHEQAFSHSVCSLGWRAHLNFARIPNKILFNVIFLHKIAWILFLIRGIFC